MPYSVYGSSPDSSNRRFGPSYTGLLLPVSTINNWSQSSDRNKVAHTRLIPVLDSQPAGDVSQKPGGRLPLLSARPAVIPATLKRAATNFAAW